MSRAILAVSRPRFGRNTPLEESPQRNPTVQNIAVLKGYESQESNRCGGVQEQPSDQQAGARLIHGFRDSGVPYL